MPDINKAIEVVEKINQEYAKRAMLFHDLVYRFEDKIEALSYTLTILKKWKKLPSEAELHEIWYKTTGIEISLTIHKGLKAISKRIGKEGKK